MKSKCEVCGVEIPDGAWICAECHRKAEVGLAVQEGRLPWIVAYVGELRRSIRTADGVIFVLWAFIGVPASSWIIYSVLPARLPNVFKTFGELKELGWKGPYMHHTVFAGLGCMLLTYLLIWLLVKCFVWLLPKTVPLLILGRPSVHDKEMEMRIVGRWKGSYVARGVKLETETIFSPSGMIEMTSNAVINGVPRRIISTGTWKIRRRSLKCYFTKKTFLAIPDVDSEILHLDDKELQTQQRDSVATMYRQDGNNRA